MEEQPVLDTIPVEIPKEKTFRCFDEKMSDEIGALALALSKAQGAMTNPKKDTAAHNYKYATLDQIIDIARGPLSDNELAVIQTHELNLNNSTPSVVTHTTLVHSSGQWHKSSLELPIEKGKMTNKAQAFGVSASYARRYAMQALLLMMAEVDTDGTSK